MSKDLIGELKSNPIINRYKNNPILAADDVPYDSSLVFNAGITKYQGKYVMVFRNDYYSEEKSRVTKINLGLAYSDDGVNWDVQPDPCFELEGEDIVWAYDPRLTVIDDRCYMCFAVDTHHGIRGGIAVTDDFKDFEVLSLSVPDNRNMVLFPKKLNGKYLRLERPFPVYSRGEDRFDIWLSDSPDLKYWGNSKLVLGVEDIDFSNNKIGPGAPPVKTEAGWLTTFHAVDLDPEKGKNGWQDIWQKRYTAGIMLLDLDNPSKVIGLSEKPLLAPEVSYEVEGGYRNDVIFPTGMLLEDDGEVKIYYGAADTVMALATANVDDLIKACQED